jgi:hypothetical protein
MKQRRKSRRWQEVDVFQMSFRNSDVAAIRGQVRVYACRGGVSQC